MGHSQPLQRGRGKAYLDLENVCLVVWVHENAQNEARKEWPESAVGLSVIL